MTGGTRHLANFGPELALTVTRSLSSVRSGVLVNARLRLQTHDPFFPGFASHSSEVARLMDAVAWQGHVRSRQAVSRGVVQVGVVFGSRPSRL